MNPRYGDRVEMAGFGRYPIAYPAMPAFRNIHKLPFAETLLHSDAFYFDLGAEIITWGGVSIAWMPAFAHLPAGCVVQRVHEIAVREQGPRWLAELEQRLLHLGVPLGRIYLQQPIPWLELLLKRAGYESKIEVGFLAEPLTTASSIIQLHEVCNESDWQAKLEVHRDTDVGSDGYTNPPEAWTALVRAKCATGRKKSYIIQYQGTNVGTIGAIELGNLLRVKNVFLTPAFRQLRLGRAAIEQLRQHAFRHGKLAVGVFGIENSSGCEFYRRCGFLPATYQVEWTRNLVSVRPDTTHSPVTASHHSSPIGT